MTSSVEFILPVSESAPNVSSIPLSAGLSQHPQERALQLVLSLNDAVFRGDNDRARAVIAEVPSPSFWRQVSQSYSNYSPLHFAAASGRLDLALTLIDGGFSVDAVDAERRTALHWAAAEGQEELVLELAVLGAVPSFQDARGDTPLHLACRAAHLAAARQLLANGARVNVRAADGSTPLHAAVAAGSVPLVAALLAAGAHLHAADDEGDTPLHWNARLWNEHPDAAPRIHQLLLQQGASLSLPNADGETTARLLRQFAPAFRG